MINIDILKPQCRIDDLWVRVITKNDVDLPLPQSRLELYVTALITGNIDNLPYPQSRVEMLLYCILTDTEYTFNAQSRVEMFLKAIITLDIEGLPTPMSRLEWYLDYIVRNGCLEKYEYYPFSIWNYLNVKNTPKARMKFKSMKGNTLVNLARAVNLTIDDKSPTTNNIPFNSVQGFQAGKKYTIICKFEGYKGTKPIKFRQRKYDTSWNYEFNTLIKDFSDGIKITVYTPTQDFKDVALYLDYVDEKDTSVSISDVIILEGDHTQNPPNGYIEGMKSFGDGANEIEVLSCGKNLFNNIDELIDIHNLKEICISGIGVGKRLVFSAYDSNKNIISDIKAIKYISGLGFYVNTFNQFNLTDNSKNGIEIFENISIHYISINYHSSNTYETLVLSNGKDVPEYKPYQSSKAIPMYRNANNELVPVPVLRGKWDGDRFLCGDEILLHEDGKLYYHKRCFVKNFIDGLNWYNDSNSQLGENLISFAYDADSNIKVGTRICSDKYNEITSSTVSEGLFCSTSKNGIRIKINKSKCTDLKSLDAYIRNNNFSVVVELAKEEVYPCELSEQLYSYDVETNIFINGGAVVGESIIEVGTKLGPIVAEIKQETLRNARAVEGLLAHGVQEMAYQLYPEDFNKSIETVPTESVE